MKVLYLFFAWQQKIYKKIGRLGVFYFGVYIIPMIYYGGVLIGILKEVEMS